VVRKTLYALLALGPVVIALDRAGIGASALFLLASVALVPLAWLIGEATEQAGCRTTFALLLENLG
jgi:Ca2+/H+ antiporter